MESARICLPVAADRTGGGMGDSRSLLCAASRFRSSCPPIRRRGRGGFSGAGGIFAHHRQCPGRERAGVSPCLDGSWQQAGAPGGDAGSRREPGYVSPAATGVDDALAAKCDPRRLSLRRALG